MRTVIRAIGRVLITVGLLILLFVAYQLWGTGIYEARAQSDLQDKFDRQVATRRRQTTTTTTTAATTATTSATTPPSTAPPTVQPPAEGDPVGVVTIDKIGVDKVVVEGTTVPDLRKGPGHYQGSPQPGQIGNAAIAGHRTTYGAPFGDLDQLTGPKDGKRGDTISVRTVTGTWRYELTEDPFAVSPSQIEVLDPVPGQATLTLTTCNPKYSASERLIVKAQLTGQQPLPAPGAQPRLVVDTGLSGGSESRTPVYVWGFIAAAVGGLWWLVFHRYPRWTTWFGGAIPFLVVLFFFYTYLERVLPNNY